MNPLYGYPLSVSPSMKNSEHEEIVEALSYLKI